MHNHIGHSLIGTANMIRRSNFGESCGSRPNLTAMQNFFLGILYMNEKKGKATYQKDLEAEFSIRRSTASGILSLMEENQLIERTPSPRDARFKSLSLTEKSREICEHREKEIEVYEQKLTAGFSEEEISSLLSMLKRIRKNVENIEKEKERML